MTASLSSPLGITSQTGQWRSLCGEGPSYLCVFIGYLYALSDSASTAWGPWAGTGALGLRFKLRTVETSHWKDQVTLC